MRSTSVLPLLLALAAAPFSLGGCETTAPKTALNYSADAKRAYDAAMEEFHAHNWIESQALFRELKQKYSVSNYARLAELRIADADFEQDKFADSIREYRQFVHDHREHPEVPYARARIAESQYREIADSFLLPAGEERDQATIMDAYKELKGYLHDYPEAKESKRMRELLADVTSRLVMHELYVARFYLDKDNYEAAIGRIQYALRNFAGGMIGPGGDVRDDSGLEAEALLLMGEVYLKMHKWTEARESFVAIVKRYPNNALVVQASNYLDYMQKRGV